MKISRDWQGNQTHPMRYCPSLTPAFLMGELTLISTKGKQVSNASSNLSLRTAMPMISLLLFHLLLGVTSIVLTFRYLVLTILIFTVLSTFWVMSCRGEALGRCLLGLGASLSSISEGDLSASGGMTSTMKSKKRSTLPWKGLFSCTATMRYPSPFWSGSLELLLFPMIQMIKIIPSFDACELINTSLDMNIRVAIVLLMLVLATARKNLKDANKDKKEEDKTVVEANHFYSNHELNTTYEINSLEKNKSLIFLLKHGDKKDKELRDNPITISLISGTITETCLFEEFSDMCGINKVDEDTMKLKLQCKKLPCELSWIIYQPNVVSEDGTTEIQKFVEVNQNFDHATIIVSCNDPNIKTFAKDIQLFTNSEYTKVEDNGVLYYLFDNEKKGYYFITTENEGARKCAHAVMKHSNNEIEFNKNILLQDFLLPEKVNEYLLVKQPDFDFRIDSFFHYAKGGIDVSEKEGIKITLVGENGKDKVNISSMTIQGNNKRSVDFSAIFKKPTEKYETLVLNVEMVNKEKKGSKEIIILSMDFATSERQEVNIGETTYFKLSKGQTLNFKLIPEVAETDDSRVTHIFSSDEASFTPSLKECKTKSGCEFTLEAKETGQGNLYFGEKKVKDTEEIVYLDFNNAITKKMREGEKAYLKTTLKAKKAVQAVVNSPNVLIYAARKEKCQVVSQECHEKVFNFHNPGIYELKEDSEVIFMVDALDNCEFTLTLIDAGAQYIELQDSQPFTYLFDDGQKELFFKFKLANKEDAHFNLIGPVDELTLSVFNRVEIDEASQGEVSTDGYITFAKDSIQGLNFIIKVEKRQAYLEKFIHFTILVSTKDGNVRLESGVSQFQTIPAQETRDFVFEYEPSKDMLLNFYTHNMKTDINVLVQVSTTDEYDKDDEINEYTLDVESDVVDIKKVAKDLCKQEAGENCELFLRLTNKMSVLIDITVTLMVKDSIIELKDGIWNSYQINTIAQNTNFYFLPKNKNRSITILYRSDFVDLKLMYSLWKTDDKSINPAEWPFPHDYKSKGTTNLAFTPTKFIHIDSAALKGCWPNCVVLISTFKDEKSLKGVYNNFLQESQFKIMATSNFIEVPQKQKIDVILKKEQSKHLLIDLKYVLEKEAVTIFTYFTIGSVQLSGNVYEQSNPRCPTGDDPSDFRFGNLQTQISVATIKKKLEENNMNLDKNPYICILAQAYIDSKFSIEYASDDGLMKQLMLDSFYTHKAEAGKINYFQVDGSQEFTLKLTRTVGFPYLTHTVCKSGDDFEECLQKFKDSKDKEYQIADKMTTVSQTPCEKCIFFFRIDSREASEINIHVQSKYSETELIENQMMTDELDAKAENKYLLTSVKNEEIIINIQILHGDIEVNIVDFNQLNLTKKNAKGSTNIHIVIPPKQNKPKDDKKGLGLWGETLMGLFDYSTFNSLHLVIKSQNESVSAMYTITYSSGDPQIYLQDGLISEYAILPNKTTKFLYQNPSLSRIYLHISTADAQILNKLQVKIKALKDESDEDSAIDIVPETPNFKKKTPNPTMIMTLPPNKLFQIDIFNPDKALQVITIGINNKEIIYLPYNHEFPVQLLKNEYIYLVINVPFQTHLNVQFKKCDESSLSISYTTSYDEFVREEFSYEQEMGEEELITSLQIKTQTSGSAYVKIKSPEDDDSLLTVKATFSFIKNKVEKAKAGNKGLVEYRMVDMQNAEISFSPIICPASMKTCSKEFAYSSISSIKVQDIYAQLVCSSVSFDLADRQITSQVDSSPISASPNHEGKITFTQALKQSNEFVGVKAANNKTGEIVYYKPVQIMTYWGQISKQGKSHSWILAFLFLSCFICCLSLLCYRRKSRPSSEYAPLAGIE